MYVCLEDNPDIPEVCSTFSETTLNLGREFPNVLHKYYQGRGPINLRWNGMYGKFSKAYYDSNNEGWKELLENPNRVSSNS